MNNRDRVVVAGGEFVAHGLGIDGLAPVELEGSGGPAAALGDIEPLVGKGTVHAVEHLLFYDITQGTLHDAPRRTGGEIDGILSVAQRLEIGLDRVVECHEIGAAVTDHALGHGQQRFFGDGDRTGNEKFIGHDKQRIAEKEGGN